MRRAQGREGAGSRAEGGRPETMVGDRILGAAKGSPREMASARRALVAVSLAAIATQGCGSSPRSDGSPAPSVARGHAGEAADEQSILALEDAWGRALQQKDRRTLTRIVAPDFTFIEPDGSVRDRESYLQDRSNDPVEIASFVGSDVRVKVFGETALVTGVSTIDETRGGKRYRFSLRWKELWRKNPVGWQVVAGQATPVNPAWDAPFGEPVPLTDRRSHMQRPRRSQGLAT